MHQLCAVATQNQRTFHNRLFLSLRSYLLPRNAHLYQAPEATVPNFRLLYVRATSTLSSSLLPPLGVNAMGLLLRSSRPGTHRADGKGAGNRHRPRGKREEGEMSQRTRRNRYGGKAKEEMVSSEEPRAEQETAYSHRG